MIGANEGSKGQVVPNPYSWDKSFFDVSSKRVRRDRPPIGGARKRCFDISVALAVVLLLLPLIILVALLVYFTSPGPVIYRHKRVGFNGKEFSCLKFRTMRQNGDQILQVHFAQFPDALSEWVETRKLTNDPRVTRLGAFLRKSSLDELPQVFNILRGDMSLVGPRPIVHDELTMYGAKASHYLMTRPGLTGAWQISGRSDTTYAERVALDANYVTEWSFARDILILVQTVPAVLAARGSR